MNFILENWEVISTIIFGALTMFFGARFQAAKKAIKETTDVMIELRDALEDDKVTEDEMHEIIDEAEEALEAWKLVFKKAAK